MSKKYIFLFYILVCTFEIVAQGSFHSPIQGNYGKEFIIVNYVDWGVGSAYSDNHCLDKTYNGHQGTDYVIKNFASMDSGINVLAVDSGVVIFVKDGLFDKETKSDTSKKLGNYIGIAHSGKFQTYYGHLKKNSILVSVGNTVLPGMPIAQVGSSGNSSDPHLHFELWYDSLYYIDPYKGPCGNPSSYWKNPDSFDSSFAEWTTGMLGFKPNLDTLKYGLASRDTFYEKDSAIALWSLQYGLRTGDSLKLKWEDPAGKLWFQYDIRINQNWWYYYYWSFIDPPKLGKEGMWSAKLYRNNKLEIDRSFYYFHKQDSVKNNDTVSVQINASSEEEFTLKSTNEYWEIIAMTDVETMSLYDLNGDLIKKYSINNRRVTVFKSDLPRGIYSAIFRAENKNKLLRLVNF